MPAARLVVIWDFDWSMINENTDTWIIEQLAESSGIVEAMKDATRIPVWTDRVTEALRCIHDKGVGRYQLLDRLKTIPFHPGMKEAVITTEYVALLKKAGAHQIILSDSNTEFIACILAEHNLQSCMSEVITNPASFTDNGRLIARTRQPLHDPHRCLNCPPQLCKGLELTKALQRHALAPGCIVYIGDGAGDFCPCLQLKETDVILARDGFTLLDKLKEAGDAIRARVLVWADGHDAVKYIGDIIDNKRMTGD